MRLIDADALKYTMLYKENFLMGTGVEAPAVWKSDVDDMPTIDAVPVVRCRECKWADWYVIANGKKCCHCIETEARGRTETDYCSYGEREDGDGDG